MMGGKLQQIKIMNSQERKENTKEKLKSLGKRNRRFIILSCIVCKREFKIRTNDRSIYTEEVIKNWKCLSCLNKKENIR